MIWFDNCYVKLNRLWFQISVIGLWLPFAHSIISIIGQCPLPKTLVVQVFTVLTVEAEAKIILSEFTTNMIAVE